MSAGVFPWARILIKATELLDCGRDLTSPGGALR